MKRILAALAVLISSQVTPVAADAAPTDITNRFEPVSPCRLLDTRETRGVNAPVSAGTTLEVVAAETCGISPDAAALALTVTAVDARRAGFISVYPSAISRPNTSNINYSTNSTIANGAITKVSDGASFKIFTNEATHIVIDVSGQFLPAAEATTGRFVPLAPERVLDTRQTGQRGSSSLRVALPDNVPADAIAMAVSVTIVDAPHDTYATVHPAGTAKPDTSTVNSDHADHTRGTTAITPVSAGGFDVYRHRTSDIVVDVWGYMTGPSAELSADGLYVPVDPFRSWDSRTSFDPLHPGGWTSRSVGTTSSAAVVANITAVDTLRPGWVSSFPAGHVTRDVSILNVSSRDPRSAQTIVRTSDTGLGLMSFSGAHLLIDVFGHFTGPSAATGPVADHNPPNQQRRNVLFISDSSLAGIRWSGHLHNLVGANIVPRLESCRRLIGVSCRGREGYAPPTALSTLRHTPGRYDTLIIGTGYNEGTLSVARGFEEIMATARARNITQVLWITYRTDTTYTSPRALSNALSFMAHNRFLRAMKASGQYPELELVDWNTYSAGRSTWVTPDGVHLQPAGAAAVSWYLSNTLAALDRKPCPAPSGVLTAGGWCALPDAVGFGG